jgi:alkylhydroperoxidase family enzyme
VPTASTCTPRSCGPGGESEQRLYLLNAWRESPFYSDRERAALAFDEQELANLTLAVIAINGANRLNIAFRTIPGAYRPATRHAAE